MMPVCALGLPGVKWPHPTPPFQPQAQAPHPQARPALDSRQSLSPSLKSIRVPLEMKAPPL